MYNVENTTEFFLGKDNFLYLIYAYGNDNYTSELDLVIFQEKKLKKVPRAGQPGWG